MAHRLLDDPFVSRQIDAALAPFVAALEPEALAWARERLALLLEEDPHGRALYDAAHPRQVDSSGERKKQGLPIEDPEAGTGGASG